MSRRASLPGAAELFRTTSAPEPEPAAPPVHPGVGAMPAVRDMTAGPGGAPSHPAEAEASFRRHPSSAGRTVRSTRRIRSVGERNPSGRERHEEKITVYCSADELLDLESARLHLRAEHGLAVDRGRIVREAVAVVLADLEAKGEASILVRRLHES